jgi:hypothetical protein
VAFTLSAADAETAKAIERIAINIFFILINDLCDIGYKVTEKIQKLQIFDS